MAREAVTHLMFQGEAGAALEMYASIFPAFHLERIERWGTAQPGREGWVKMAHASLAGHRLMVIDSPVHHDFSFTPAMSLLVECETAEELDAAFDRLSAGGRVYMPVGSYGFSTRFGWCSDRFGVSWQLKLR